MKFILSEDGSRAVNIDRIEEVVVETFRARNPEGPPLYRILLVLSTITYGAEIYENAVVVFKSEDENKTRAAHKLLLQRLTEGITAGVERPALYTLTFDATN